MGVGTKYTVAEWMHFTSCGALSNISSTAETRNGMVSLRRSQDKLLGSVACSDWQVPQRLQKEKAAQAPDTSDGCSGRENKAILEP